MDTRSSEKNRERTCLDVKKVEVSSVSIIGWGGGPSMTYGIFYTGRFSVEMDKEFQMLKLVALQKSSKHVSNKSFDIEKGTVIYTAPNTVREML
jgi:hypothetical protein